MGSTHTSGLYDSFFSLGNERRFEIFAVVVDLVSVERKPSTSSDPMVRFALIILEPEVDLGNLKRNMITSA